MNIDPGSGSDVGFLDSYMNFLLLENINPTENAISAVTKILQYNGSACHMDQILPVWLVCTVNQ